MGSFMDDEQVALSRSIRLIEVLPEFAGVIPAEDRDLADRVLMVSLLTVSQADLAELFGPAPDAPFALLITEGVVLKETTLSTRSALELLGPGALLGPPLNALHQQESRAISRYLAHGTVSAAVLNNRFRQAARRWPGLSDIVHERLAQQTHHASMHMAMLHLPRVEDRIVALFSDLAERFGRVSGDEVTIGLSLTHDVLGRLVGSRRPTVSLALSALDEEGVLRRRTDASWALARRALP